ncbi:elongation factor P 5-aminopentanone reductase [Alkalihalobacillus sp. AL-G]|uniref:elongation factor P 5-aminopentanone reductase n=1 Tax=Alkalihalobacillus sp. AL-G TaxID=2926399 RepID=UPI00272C3578|nr:SDR family oxidoreductase [Alkalihalobacillus sp. AL-G]WLD95217.1 SDR family oxidoreductase [Alkalihalobacillus sp. AL-G]
MKKYALITGASGDIGKSIAAGLAADGYNLYIHYFQNKQSCEQLKNELDKRVECHLVQADLAQADGVQNLVRQLSTPIDVLVYNCGRSVTGLITDVSPQELDEMTQLHLKSPFQIVQYLLPNMISEKEGSVVMISSIWGETGASCEVLYSMVKGGINSMVKALSKELAPSGIRVNAVAPGMVATKMNQYLTEEELDDLQDDIPLGRLGLPDEIADAVGFLVSKKSSYITGQIISVNGAWYC